MNEIRDKHRTELERVKGLSSDFADKYEAVLEEKVKFEKMLAQEKAEGAGLKSEVSRLGALHGEETAALNKRVVD